MKSKDRSRSVVCTPSTGLFTRPEEGKFKFLPVPFTIYELTKVNINVCSYSSCGNLSMNSHYAAGFLKTAGSQSGTRYTMFGMKTDAAIMLSADAPFVYPTYHKSKSAGDVLSSPISGFPSQKRRICFVILSPTRLGVQWFTGAKRGVCQLCMAHNFHVQGSSLQPRLWL